MLVICNGAIKSGSTWLYNILLNLRSFERPPDHYLTENSRRRQNNPCIRPEMLASFLASEDVVSRDYMSKNHLGRPEQRDLLMRHPHVFVFDIERDVRDMVVSAFYDERNRHGYRGSFADFYWSEGRYVADSVLRYHDTWRQAGERFCMVSYEALHGDFAREAGRIAATLGMSLSEAEMSGLRDRTSMGALRKSYAGEALYEGDKFFRKGVVGDWRSHFDDPMTVDIDRIRQRGIGRLDLRALARRVRTAMRGSAPR